MLVNYCVDLWYAVEWDGEGGDYTQVPRKWILNNENPAEGEHVDVTEVRTKKVYGGVVIRKGI